MCEGLFKMGERREREDVSGSVQDCTAVGK